MRYLPALQCPASLFKADCVYLQSPRPSPEETISSNPSPVGCLLPVSDHTLYRLIPPLLDKGGVPEKKDLLECLRGDPPFCLWSFLWYHWHGTRAEYVPLDLVPSNDLPTSRPVETVDRLAEILRRGWPHWLKWEAWSPFEVPELHHPVMLKIANDGYAFAEAFRCGGERASASEQKEELVAMLVGCRAVFLWGLRCYSRWLTDSLGTPDAVDAPITTAWDLRPRPWKNWRSRKTFRRLLDFFEANEKKWSQSERFVMKSDARPGKPTADEPTPASRHWGERLEEQIVDRFPAVAGLRYREHLLETHYEATLESEKIDGLAEFAAGAGHEINNPLAIIGGHAQLLLETEKDPHRRRQLAIMAAQVRRAHEMIADIRLFARPPQPRFEGADPNILIEEVIETVSPDAREQTTELVHAGRRVKLQLLVDPVQVKVALQALVRNALEALGHQGKVVLSCRRWSREVAEIQVEDDGPGIPAEIRPFIFSPYFSGRQAGRGLGFGLSKAWQIARLSGGSITVESEKGQGTVFRLFLPIRRAAKSRPQ